MAIGRGSGGWGRRKPFGGGMAGGLAGRGAQGLSAGGGGAGGTRIGMSDFMRNMPEGMNSISTSGEWNYIDPSTLPPEATRRPDGEISRLNPHCFVAGTKVAVQNKETKNIEDIEVGDLVVCCDTSTGTLEESAVTHTFKHPDTDGYLVINESLGVTPNHEIYTGTDWVSAANLKVGDNIQMIGGDLATVSNIEKVDKPVTTYNLEVANRHNYYADGFLVHNKLVIMPGDKERANKRHEMFVDKYGPDYMKRDDYKELQKKHPREKTPITWRTRRDLTDMEKNTPISPITINGAPAGGMPAPPVPAGGGAGGSWVPGYGPGGQTPTNPMGGGAPAGGARGLSGGFGNLFNRLQSNAQSNAFNNYSRSLGNRRMF